MGWGRVHPVSQPQGLEQNIITNKAQDRKALTEMFPFFAGCFGGILFPHYEDFSFLLEKKSKTGHSSLLPKICSHEENSTGCGVRSGTHCPIPLPGPEGCWREGTQAVPVLQAVCGGWGALPQAGTTWSPVSEPLPRVRATGLAAEEQ